MRLCTDPTCTCRTQLPHHINPKNIGCVEPDCIRRKDHPGPHSSTLTDAQMSPSDQPSPNTPQLPRAEELIHRMLQKALVESVLVWLGPDVELPLSGPQMRAMKDHGHKLKAFRAEWAKKGIRF